MDTTVELRAVITDFMSKMSVVRGEMDKTSKKGASSFESLGKASGLGLAAVGAAAAAVAVVSVKAGMELQDSQRRLSVAVADSGGNFKALQPQIQAADKMMEKFGFTNAQTQDALAVMTTGLGSGSKAVSALGVAADLASFKHVTLAQAGLAVTKAMEGNLRPLHQIGVDLPVAASSAEKLQVANEKVTAAQQAVNAILLKFPSAANPASAAHAAYEKAVGKVVTAQGTFNNLSSTSQTIMKDLSRIVGGQAADAANTFSGKINTAKAQLEDTAAKIGEKLIPILETLATKVAAVIGWFDKHKAAAQALAGVLGGVALVAMGLWVASLFVVGGALAFVTSEMVIATGGLLLLVPAAVYVATHWNQVWGDVKKVFDDAVAFLRTKFGTLVVLLAGPLAPLALLALHWQQVWNGTLTVLRTVISGSLTWFRVLGDGFFTLIQGILTAGSHLPFVGKYFVAANNAVKAAHADFDSTMTQWAKDANNFGSMVGTGMGAGLQAGIRKSLPPALAASASMVSQVIHQMHESAGNPQSPSKLTVPIGEALGMGVSKGIENQQLAAMKAAGAFVSNTITTIGGGAGAGGSGVAGSSNAANQALGQAMAANVGWVGAQWTALNNVVMRESGWNATAQNPTSTAYGIAQSLYGYGAYGNTPAGQIAWMLNYIAQRYGSPEGAWAHELSAGWYDRGGWLPTGLSLAMNQTGRPERILGPGEGAGGTVINLTVQGTVVSEQDLINTIHTGLLRKKRATPLGLA